MSLAVSIIPEQSQFFIQHSQFVGGVKVPITHGPYGNRRQAVYVADLVTKFLATVGDPEPDRVERAFAGAHQALHRAIKLLGPEIQ
jgi:hypothetical protein